MMKQKVSLDAVFPGGLILHQRRSAARFLRKCTVLLETGWTQGAAARGGSGCEVDVFDPDATCFCATGALDRIDQSATSVDYSRARLVLGMLVWLEVGMTSIVSFNDASDTRKSDVLRLFRDAVEVFR